MKTLSLLMLFILTACMPSFDKTTLSFDDGAISVKPIIAEGETVTFEVLKEKLLVPYCISCHKHAGDENKVSHWVSPGKVEDSKLYKVIKDGSMPKKAAVLDTRYLDLVVRYIESVKAPEIPPTTTTTGGFAEIKQKILVPHCIKCHEDVDNEAALMSWIVPGKPQESDFYLKTHSGEMPEEASPLPLEDVELIGKYIESMKPLAAVSFEEIKTNILVPKCLSCHKKMGDETLLISKWVTVGDLENSKMYKAVVNGSMPKKADRLSDDEIAAIASYIKSVKPL